MRQSNINKSLVMSVIALCLVIVLAATVTFSWVEGGDKGYIEGSELVISTGSNLTMRQDGKALNSIIIPACTLEETSSADGRNYFFPLGGNESSTTANMLFREGTPQDVNTKYISLDFELEAGDSATDVYLGAGTIVQCSNEELLSALRMSFYLNDGSIPKVFKPNQMPGVSMTYNPVTTITEAGVPTTTNTPTDAYGDYYYQGEGSSLPIFELEKGETKRITLAIWLEGTAFSGSAFEDSDLSIYIDFTTTVDDLVKYTFRDNTHGYSDAKAEYWIKKTDTYNGSSYDTMMYIFDNSAQRYYAMTKTSDTTWEAYVPQSITDFYFRRYSIDIDQWWNEWEPDMSDIKTDPNGTHTFIAICGNGADSGTELAGCRGYWQDENDTIRVYFKNNVGWDNLKCYSWRTDGSYATDQWKVGLSSSTVGTDVWPGKILNWSHNDADDGVAIYYIDLTRASEIAGIQFNNSVNTAEFDIKDTQYFFNGFATWYTSSSSYGHWTYTDSTNSLINPST